MKIGDRFDKLEIVAELATYGHRVWKCQCDCGLQKIIGTSSLEFSLRVNRAVNCGHASHDERMKKL